MSELDDAPPPMDPALRAQLRGSKTMFDAEAGAHESQAFERLARAIPGLVPGPGGDGGGGDGGGGGTEVPVASIATKIAQTSLAKLVVPIVASALVGGGVGAVAMRELGPPRERIVYVDRVVSAPPPAVSVAPPASAARAMRVADLPSVPTVAAVPPPAAPSALIAVERSLLDGARSAFATGDYETALERLRHHAERHPSGVLAEEREALTIRTLVALGRKPEAKARASAFASKYPESIMRPAVEAAIGDPR